MQAVPETIYKDKHAKHTVPHIVTESPWLSQSPVAILSHRPKKQTNTYVIKYGAIFFNLDVGTANEADQQTQEPNVIQACDLPEPTPLREGFTPPAAEE
jgi:hypothetical protein